MDWKKIYNERKVTAEEAVSKYVHSGDTVGLGGMILATSSMNAIFDKLRSQDLGNITFVGDLVVDKLPLTDETIPEGSYRYQSVFFGGRERKGYAEKNVSFIPTQFHHYTEIIRRIHPQVAVIPLSPPDEDGYCSIGPINACINQVVVEHSNILIGEINQHMPIACGDERLKVHVKDIDAIVEFDLPMTKFPVAPIAEQDQIVANHILEHIPDGSTIQLGLGGMANAIGYGLKVKKHLGIHTEMFTESMMELMKLGVVDNSQKTFMTGVSVAGFALGNQELYDFCHNNKQTYFGPFDFVNNVEKISRNDNMISINNAMNVDLFGQVNAQSVGYKHFSGTGGQVDYVRGALHSKGGKSFIALPSSRLNKAGELESKITLSMPEGTTITTLASDVQYVVTEYGCVDLFAKDVPTRAKLLISIAHPEFREKLMFDAKQKYIIY